MISELASDVYCLGPRGPTQTDVYLVRCGRSWALIDAGWANDGPSIKAAAESLFGSAVPPAVILLTHVHPDHAGSALELARTWGCEVYVHPDEVAIAQGDFSAMIDSAGPLDRWVILPAMRAMGRRRRETMIARSSLREVARAFDPAGGVPGLAGWECIPTPGHTPGHVSFFRPTDRVLISGDAVVTLRVNSVSGLVLGSPGLSGPPRYTSCSWGVVKASVAALAGLEPNVLAGGHGTPMTGPGTAGRIRAAVMERCQPGDSSREEERRKPGGLSEVGSFAPGREATARVACMSSETGQPIDDINVATRSAFA